MEVQKNPQPAARPEDRYAPVRAELLALVARGEIDSFAKVQAFLDARKLEPVREIVEESFQLLKRLNWGMFSCLSRERFPRLWDELVISDRRHPDYGDLKNYTSLSEIYVAILDIHGYTSFCQETKKNLTMLQRLDRFVSFDITQLAASHGVIASRERGDEILLVGSDAVKMVQLTFGIMQMFSKSRSLGEKSGAKGDFYLPAFQLSAGIAGGQPTIPLIITEKGNLSGFLVNSAARLQGRANTLSPKENKVIVEQYVLRKFQESPESKKPGLEQVRFFQNGEIAFKGVTLRTYEAYIHNPRETYKTALEPPFIRLQEALRDNQWQNKVFLALCETAMVAAKTLPPFDVLQTVEGKTVRVVNEYVVHEFIELRNCFTDADYRSAFRRLGEMCDLLGEAGVFDAVVLETARLVHRMYLKAFEVYDGLFTQYLAENAQKFLSADEFRVWDYRKRLEPSYQRIVRNLEREESTRDKRLLYWNNSVEAVRRDMDYSIYSGKK
jgi:class 3 adenylate cyclase